MSLNFKLIVGIGNPGEKYKNTYHNVGFLFVDYLKSALESREGDKPRTQSARNFRYVTLNGQIIAKSSVFMNESGSAVKEILKYFRLKPAEILVVHDDSDIELGNYKVSFDRSEAGHKGVESITRVLKTKSFSRLRIGVRQTSPLRLKAGEFVLKKINAKDKKLLEGVFKKAITDTRLKLLDI